MEYASGNGSPHRPLETHARRSRGWNELLWDNQLGIIDNPVRYRNREDLEKDIDTFYEAHNLENHVDIELLKRGGRLAQNPRMFRAKGHLSGAEKRALEREDDPKFLEQPKELQVILITCCIGAIVQGWSQANITGANLHWPVEFGLNIGLSRDSQGFHLNNAKWSDIWTFGAVNGVTFFAASLIGAWLSDPLNEYFTGRRGALFVSGLFSFGAAIGAAYTQRWETLFVARLLQGVGMGAKASVVPIFESEVAPSRIRGRMLVSWQTFTAIGIFLGSGANIIVHDSWRLQVASAFIPAVPLLCLVFVCTESPRWLIKRSRYEDAFKSLSRLRETELQAARDLYSIHAQIQVETLLISDLSDLEEAFQDWCTITDHTRYQDAIKKTNFFGRSLQLFTVSRNRRASLAAAVAMVSQQLSGFNIFAFLAATFFHSAGYSLMDSLWFSLGFAAANAIFSPIAYWYIDSKGRRFLLLWSLVAMFPLLLATAFSFEISTRSRQDGAVAFFLILYTAAYSPGSGVVPFLYSSEVFPLVNREVGMSLSCGINFLLAGVVGMATLPLTLKIGPTKLLGLFAGLDAAAAILVWLLLPSTTKATTLEEMNYVFGVPTRKHIRYQIFTVLPWVVRDYIPWIIRQYWPGSRRDEPEAPTLDPLYKWIRMERLRQQEQQGEEQELDRLISEDEEGRRNREREENSRGEPAPQLPPLASSTFPGMHDYAFPPGRFESIRERHAR